MARFLIYSTGTTWTGTILRLSATNNPSVGEASLSNDVFVFPEIQPLYLWQVSGGIVIPNTDAKIILYEESIAPAPTPQDLITYGEVTGMTETKIDKVSGITNQVPVFTVGGGLQGSGYTIPQLTGLTTYTFVASGGTHIGQVGNAITIYSPSGETTSWNLISDKPQWLSGTTLSAFETGHTHNQYLTNAVFSGYTGTTKTLIDSKLAITTFTGYTATTSLELSGKIDKLTGATNNLAIFDASGNVISAAKQLTNTVRGTGSATDGYVPSEKGVRDAITAAIAATIILQGDWNASTNTPDLQVSGITTGYAWRVSASGTTTLGAISVWAVGDLAIKSATGWMKIANQDIAAIWGNIDGTLSNQTDLWNILTGQTAAINTKLNTSTFTTYTGDTETLINTKLNISTFTGYSATTKSDINYISGQTDTKLPIATFTGYTASTANVDKKIQVVSTSTADANVISPLIITWNSAPISADTYLWSGGTDVWIKSAGIYELQYHVVLKNSTSNQTHSVGAYVVKNGATLPLTATAAMIVGPSSSGELSLPPTVLTLALNDKLDLAAFRIGNTGTANLVSDSVFMTLNKLT